MKKIEDYVLSIPDFPEPGIIFRIKLLLSPDICISRLTGGYKPSGNINSNSE